MKTGLCLSIDRGCSGRRAAGEVIEKLDVDLEAFEVGRNVAPEAGDGVAHVSGDGAEQLKLLTGTVELLAERGGLLRVLES